MSSAGPWGCWIGRFRMSSPSRSFFTLSADPCECPLRAAQSYVLELAGEPHTGEPRLPGAQSHRRRQADRMSDPHTDIGTLPRAGQRSTRQLEQGPPPLVRRPLRKHQPPGIGRMSRDSFSQDGGREETCDQRKHGAFEKQKWSESPGAQRACERRDQRRWKPGARPPGPCKGRLRMSASPGRDGKAGRYSRLKLHF